MNNAIKIFLVKKERKTMTERNFDNNNENCIEFLSGERYAVATFTNRKHITRLKKIYAERKDEIKYFKENKDGSICVKFPLKWVKINPGSIPDPNKPKRILTEEQKEKLIQNLKKYRESKKQ